MTPIKKLEYQLLQKEKEINELYVVIDTLQNTLGAAVSYLSEKELKDLKNQEDLVGHLVKIYQVN